VVEGEYVSPVCKRGFPADPKNIQIRPGGFREGMRRKEAGSESAKLLVSTSSHAPDRSPFLSSSVVTPMQV
jgi:hypothetical protein